MPIHEFGSRFTVDPRQGHPMPGPELRPQIKTHPPGIEQQSDVQGGRTKIMGDAPLGTHPDYIEEFLIPGFRSLDEAMKNYWSGMRVPTKDSYRFMRVKVAGGDKSVLFWRDELQGGRVRLPVASLNRTGHEYNPDKFSPPILSMAKRYTSNRLDRIARVRRPVPFLVDYDLIVWAEWKRDADNVLYQILTRFNPLAEFTMFDSHLSGNVQLRFGGSSDASDKEIGFDQKPNVRYEFKMTAEAWLPLPEKIVPSVLGHVTVIREEINNKVGDILLAALGNYNRFVEPTPGNSSLPFGDLEDAN